MSKAVKKVLTVAAAIAVAYFAPNVAATIITGGAKGAAATATLAATSTATKVITTAAVNAAGNAALAAATGGDVGKAAIIGAITGGVRGYTSSVLNPAAGAPVAGAPVAGAPAPIVGADAGGGAVPTTVSGATTFTPSAAALQTSGMAGTTAAAAPTASLGSRALAAVQEAGTEIANKFTDPRAIARLTVRAGELLAGSVIAGSGLSPAEEKLLRAQAADLEELKRTNQDLYNLRLDQARAILGEVARDYGSEMEQRARVTTGAEIAAGLSKLPQGERRRAEQAKLRRAAQEQISTARAKGELMSAENVRQARQAGLAMLPGAGPQAATMTARAGLMDMYGEAERRRQQQAGQIGDFFGSFTGKRQAGLAGFSLDDIEKESKRRRFGTIA